MATQKYYIQDQPDLKPYRYFFDKPAELESQIASKLFPTKSDFSKFCDGKFL